MRKVRQQGHYCKNVYVFSPINRALNHGSSATFSSTLVSESPRSLTSPPETPKSFVPPSHGAPSPLNPQAAHGHAPLVDPIRDLHAPTRRWGATRGNFDPRGWRRPFGDERGGAGDGGDARAGVLRTLRRARRHEPGPARSDRVDPEEQGVPEGRAPDAGRRRSELAQRAAPEGARPLRLARQLLQSPWASNSPRERGYRCD